MSTQRALPALFFAELAERLDPNTKPQGQEVVLELRYDAIGEEPPIVERYTLIV